ERRPGETRKSVHVQRHHTLISKSVSLSGSVSGSKIPHASDPDPDPDFDSDFDFEERESNADTA
ncbi:MAG: hypothetical protein K8E66_13450, partial [Phycisphaerales bacterium]|nr:hypothetical protein [Phycisphaerales bacterium]